ncbi:amidohydrolase family protein [Novosphingobium sp. ERW19]|uniref:amidohydrolase family protein n=1 Tax=Novosphingobium sp. ERW19 TaxID=2726186 RepID=UPI001457515D|nr:amidohydrolase family protein [Novosphingobium sp. ERW19]NLR39785.1 amidohydrolase family protein [Novosphingobium sp. ERW19]
MAMPNNIGIIDCMLGIPDAEDRAEWFAPFRPLIKDKQTLGQFAMPAQYMFKDIPQSGKQDDYLAWTVAQMDKHNVEKALVGWNENDTSYRAKELYPDRFFFDLPVNPNNGTEEVRRIKRIHAEVGLSAVSVFPSGTLPQVAINHKYMWPIYSACEELGLPILLNVGIPGPRIPMETQKVEHLDEVCWFFPELKVVMRHGAEPWEALAVKLMLKWPNLYYSTSAFAPKHYPKAIIDYANTRGSDKVIYAGYFPMGLSLDRIMSDMQSVPFKDEVWPKFLRENAVKVFGL